MTSISLRRPPGFYGTDSFRVTLICILVFAVGFLMAMRLIYGYVTDYEVMRVDQVLADESASLLARQIADQRANISFPQPEDLNLPIGMAGLFDRNRRYLGGAIKRWPAKLEADGVVRMAYLPSFGARVFTLAVPLDKDNFLVVARRGSDIERLEQIVQTSLEDCAAPVVIILVLCGAWFSRRTLRRAAVIRSAIASIVGGELDRRVPIDGDLDVFGRLAGDVNGMLDRIEEMVEQVKGVGDNIAHDLRGPLTRIRNHLERTRMTGEQGGILQSVIDDTVGELDQCLDVIAALLRLGRIESRVRRAAFATIDLAGVAEEVFRDFEPLAEENRRILCFVMRHGFVNADITAQQVQADRALLSEAISNLLDNAMKYTAEGGHITLSLDMEGGQALLQVADDGPGIAVGEQRAIWQRFFRSEKTLHVPGVGIGLSLVAAIARLHEIEVTITDGRPGAIFTLCFPRRDALSAPADKMLAGA